MMSHRYRTDRILRKLFPDRMKLRDQKRVNREELKLIQPNVNLTREQWIEKIKEQWIEDLRAQGIM